MSKIKVAIISIIFMAVVMSPIIMGSIESDRIKKEIAEQCGISYANNRELNARIQFYRKKSSNTKRPTYYYVVDGIETESLNYFLNKEIEQFVEIWL